jgi:hypothetical protein
LDLEELTLELLFIPSTQVLTCLTGADPLLGFARVNVLVSSLVFWFAAVSSLGVLELGRLVSWIWDFQTRTGLTGELHRPDRCRGFSVEVIKSCRGDPVCLWWVSGDPALTGMTGVVSSCSSCLFRCVLE